MPIPGALQEKTSGLVEFRHFIFAGQFPGAVAGPATQDFAAQMATPIDFEQIDRDVLRCQLRQLVERALPTLGGLVRETGDQIERDICDPRLAQDGARTVHIGGAVNATRGRELSVGKRLHAEADAVDPGAYPRRCLLRGDGLRIGLQRHFLQVRQKMCANHVHQLA